MQKAFTGILVALAVVVTAPAFGQAVYTFDCAPGIWLNNSGTGASTIGWDAGKLVVQTLEPNAGANYDPSVGEQVPLALDTTLYQEFAASITVIDGPAAPFPAEVYFFLDGGLAHVPITLQNGANDVRFNIATATDADPYAGVLNNFRIDPAIGVYADFANTTWEIDYVAITDDPSFVPTQDTMTCNPGVNITVHMTDGTVDSDLSDGTGHFVGTLALQDAVWGMQHNFDGAGLWPREGEADNATITILDSGTYVGGMLVGVRNLTVQADAGQTPTIQGAAGAWAQTIILGHDYTGQPHGASLNLIGAAPDARITVLGSQTDPHYSIHNVNHAGEGLTVQNVDFKPDPAAAGGHPYAGSGGCWGDYTFTDCQFYMVMPDGTAGQNGPWMNGNQGDYTYNNCEFISAGWWIYHCNEPTQDIAFNDCLFQGQFPHLMAGQVVFTDCAWASHGGFCRHEAWGGVPNGLDITCIRGDLSASAVDLFFVSTVGSSIDMIDCNLDFTSMALFGRTYGGDYSFTNCTGTMRPSAGFMDSWSDAGAPAPLVADVNITMDSCKWTNGAGEYGGGDQGGDFAINFTATNTFWGGTTAGGSVIENMGLHTVPGAITLTHCTMVPATGNVLINGDATRGDVLTGNYCIFDSSQTPPTAASGTIALAGVGNLCYDGDGAGAFWPGEPADTIGALPMVDGSGKLQAGSPALAAAVGSTMAVDFEGDARPAPAWEAIADIGADESASLADPDGDVDGDGLPNGWEVANNLDPTDDGSTDVNNGPDGDPDGDGVNNLGEFNAGTDPHDPLDLPLPAANVVTLGLLAGLLLAAFVAFRKRQA